jgi:hypothetical protein
MSTKKEILTGIGYDVMIDQIKKIQANPESFDLTKPLNVLVLSAMCRVVSIHLDKLTSAANGATKSALVFATLLLKQCMATGELPAGFTKETTNSLILAIATACLEAN